MKTLGSRLPGVFFLGLFILKISVLGKTWTTVEGGRTEGELLSVEGSNITLLIDGREYIFPITRFSATDRMFLNDWKKEKRCGVCRIKLEGNQMQAGKDFYHPECFSCLVCNRSFLDRQSIRRDEWGGMVHSEHFRMANSCGSCGRLFAGKSIKPEQLYSDGRLSCLVCLRDAVNDLGSLNAVSKRVRKGMSELGLPTPVGPLTLRLVNQDKLNKEVKRVHGRGSLRGLTQTTFRTVTGGRNPGTTFSHQVWILSGLPVVECVSVLAHEFGHIWLNENYIEMSPPAIEGFCNLLSMHALKKETSKLAEILRKNLQMSDDRIYGQGFREMNKKLQHLGWPGLVQDLSTRRVPLNKRGR